AILIDGCDHPIGEFADGLALLRGALDDFVVDIGDVSHVRHVVTPIAEVPIYDIEHGHHTGMTDMQVVVHGHAADIHPDVTRPDRLELLFFPGEGVVNANHRLTTK